MPTIITGSTGVDQISDNSVSASKIVNASITVSKIADANVTPAKLSQPLTSGTAQASTSGTSIDFTGIPSWVKRITVMFNGVSTNGTSQIIFQIGAGSIAAGGYFSEGEGLSTTANRVQFSTGFGISENNAATYLYYGTATITSLGNNIWTMTGMFAVPATKTALGSGALTLGGTLDRVRITTVNGTDTFDAGSINILYE